MASARWRERAKRSTRLVPKPLAILFARMRHDLRKPAWLTRPATSGQRQPALRAVWGTRDPSSNLGAPIDIR